MGAELENTLEVPESITMDNGELLGQLAWLPQTPPKLKDVVSFFCWVRSPED